MNLRAMRSFGSVGRILQRRKIRECRRQRAFEGLTTLQDTRRRFFSTVIPQNSNHKAYDASRESLKSSNAFNYFFTSLRADMHYSPLDCARATVLSVIFPSFQEFQKEESCTYFLKGYIASSNVNSTSCALVDDCMQI